MELTSSVGDRTQPLLDPTDPSIEESGDVCYVENKLFTPRSRFRSKSATRQFAPGKSAKSSLSYEHRMWLFLFGIVALWILCGAVFFYFVEKENVNQNGTPQPWTFAQALFYAINVGLGIGYGQMIVYRSGAIVFTIFYCMMGSAFIASAGAMLVQMVMEKEDGLLAEGRLLKKADRQQKFDFSRAVSVSANMSRLEKFYRKRKWRIFTFLALVVWTLGGTIFSMYGGTQCGEAAREIGCDSFLYGLFFAVTSMSTAAQIPPEHGDAGWLFTTFWIFLGIPLYGTVMSWVAETAINKFERRHTRWQVREMEVEEDALFGVATMNSDIAPGVQSLSDEKRDTSCTEINAEVILWGDFLEYRLRELKAVDRKLIDAIKDSFTHMDRETKGYLTR